MVLTHVCFDRGGVSAEHDLERALITGRQLWPDFSEGQFKFMRKPSIKGTNYKRQFHLGRISTDEYLSACLQSVGIPDTECNKAHYAAVLAAYYTRPFLPVIDLVRKLKDLGRHTSVLANASILTWHSEAAMIKDVVDVAIPSFEIGVRKPDPLAYEILLNRIEAKCPEYVLLVDDQISNVDSARTLGMKWFHFKSKMRPMIDAYYELCQYLASEGLVIRTYRQPVPRR